MDLGDGVECIPVEILPNRIPINNYDIRFDKDRNRISEIRHKEFGLIKY